MKDTKIVERMKKACADVEGMEHIHTVKEGIDLLARNIELAESKKAVNLFKKFAIYDPEYVESELPSYYSLIKDEVEARKQKALEKEGMNPETAERTRLMQELEGNRILGYARVSSTSQSLQRQLQALNDYGCQVIFQEKLSGKDTNRIEFQTLLDQAREGDTIVISELTRLARSTKDLFSIVGQLDERGIAFKSLKEAWLDTTTATGKLMFTIMAGISQFERELMLERQSDGIRVAQENGVKFGKKLDENADLDLAINLVKEGKYTMTQIAKMCNISRTTLWRRCKEEGIQ